MENLHAVVKEATRLSILDRNDVFNVETLSSREASATITQPGTRLPLLASSPRHRPRGFSPPEASTALLASAKITRFTEYTIIDRDVLERVVE
jgi:DNA-binding IclR family transcriptional regulator